MKNFGLLVALFTAAISPSAMAQEQVEQTQTIEQMEQGAVIDVPEDWTLESGAFVHLDSGTHDPDLVKRMRMRARASNKDGAGFFTEVELAQTALVNGQDGNWIQQAYGFVEIAPETELRVGRLFLAGQLNTPPPFRIETVNYFDSPYAPYAYGVQVAHTTSDLNIVADVTGKTGLSFDEGGQFDRLETSGRVSGKIGDTNVGAGWQASEDFVRLSADASWSLEHANLKGGVYFSEERFRSDGLSTYGQIELLPKSEVRPVARLNLGTDGNFDFTAGGGWYPNRNFRLLANYERRDGRDALLVRLEVAIGLYARK